MSDEHMEPAGLAEAAHALAQPDLVSCVAEAPRPGDRGFGSGAEVPDLLLTTVFDDQRSWEVACDIVEETLERVRVGTLVRFLG